jgi:hypothetical protein
MDLCALLGAPLEQMEWFREVMEDGISWHQCESIVQPIRDISIFQVFEKPAEQVFNQTQGQLMQFIRLPEAIDITERVLPKLVADWMDN